MLPDMSDKVIAAGVNVVICAHAQIKKFELPDEAGSFDRYELKMSKNVSPLVREWCDIQLFANFKTYVIATENKNHSKGTGGTKRVMYASHTASWDAKNRHGLPDEMELDFKNIAHLFGDAVTPVQKADSPVEQLKALMEKSGVTEAELQKVVADKPQRKCTIQGNGWLNRVNSGLAGFCSVTDKRKGMFTVWKLILRRLLSCVRFLILSFPD